MVSKHEIEKYLKTQSLWDGHPDKWYQAGIELPFELVTESLYPGPESDCREIWKLLHIYEKDIVNRTVLDVGCNTGYYAMRCKEMGARKVVAFDNSDWIKRGMKFAEWKGIDIEWRQKEFFEMDWNTRYDVVLAIQVLYHMDRGKETLKLMADSCNRVIMFYTKIRAESCQPDERYYIPTVNEFGVELKSLGFLIEMVNCRDAKILAEIIANDKPITDKVAIRAQRVWKK